MCVCGRRDWPSLSLLDGFLGVFRKPLKTSEALSHLCTFFESSLWLLEKSANVSRDCPKGRWWGDASKRKQRTRFEIVVQQLDFFFVLFSKVFMLRGAAAAAATSSKTRGNVQKLTCY